MATAKSKHAEHSSDDAPTRLPRGRHGLSREQVRASQRERMLDGMARAVAEQGYAATTVSDVLTRSGVGRETFYQHFADKQACFLQTLDASAERLITAVGTRSAAKSSDPLDRFERVLDAYLEALAAEPAHARTFLIEAFAAGPRAAETRFATQQRFVGITSELLDAQSAQDRFACEMLVSAISSMVTSRVATGRIDELPSLRVPVMRLLRSQHAARRA